jgi:urease accessory protein
VALVATTATLLGGDELRLDVEVGPGLRLELQDVAGTVAYHGRGRSCRIDAHLRVHEGSVLTWSGEPLVVAEGAEVTRSVRAEVAGGGRLLVRDQVALGRAGERGGDLRCRTDISYAGRPALVEELDLRSTAAEGAVAGTARAYAVGPPDGAGVVHDVGDRVALVGMARVVDTVTAVGWRPVAAVGGTAVVATAVGAAAVGATAVGAAARADAGGPPTVFSLGVPGAVARTLSCAAHETSMPRLWAGWVAQVSRDVSGSASAPA